MQRHNRRTKNSPSAIRVISCLLVISSSLAIAQVGANQINRSLKPFLEITPTSTLVIDPENPSRKQIECKAKNADPKLFDNLRLNGPNSSWEELKKRFDVTVSPDGNNIRLRFNNKVTSDDAGRYRCTGTFQSNDELDPVSVDVKVVAPPRAKNCPTFQYIVRGKKGRIHCTMKGDNISMSYSKNGVQLTPSKDHVYDNEGISFEREVEESDAGKYGILATSSDGDVEEVFINVEVLSEPTFATYEGTDLSSEQHSVEGAEALLECIASGKPKPVVYWLDPKQRNSSQVGGYIVDPNKGTLKIEKVKKSDDQGSFKCIAVNDVGKVERDVRLVVDTLPMITSFDNKTAIENKEVVLECRSSGEPSPEFSIRKSGQQSYRPGDGFFIDANTRKEGGDSNIYVYTLRLLAHRSLFGVHYCNATNRAGSQESMNLLFVSYKPDLGKTLTDQYISPNVQVKVMCLISAYPSPSITWKADNQPLVNPSSDIKVYDYESTHAITIFLPSSRQYQTFTCSAENSLGRDEKIIRPRYTTRPENLRLIGHKATPTTTKLSLRADDGGDKLRGYKIKAEGRTLEVNSPFASREPHVINETLLDAFPPMPEQILRNLLPFHRYSIQVRAFNGVGESDPLSFSIETLKPDRPEPPQIIRPITNSSLHNTAGIPSDYRNGYLLRWASPELDNGSPVSKYRIKYGIYPVNPDVEPDIIEQVSERPLNAKIGPLVPGAQYKVQIEAKNSIDYSLPDEIIIYTSADRPSMVEFESLALSWIPEFSTAKLIMILMLAVLGIVITDLVCCFWCAFGASYWLRSWYSSKNNELISDGKLVQVSEQSA